MWSIVCFVEDNSVECVPNFWVQNKLCAWPNKNCKINSTLAIERRVVPNSVEFDYCGARLLASDITSITEAYKKLKKAEVTSDLSSNENSNYKINKKQYVHEKRICISHKNNAKKKKDNNSQVVQKKSIIKSPPQYVKKKVGVATRPTRLVNGVNHNNNNKLGISSQTILNNSTVQNDGYTGSLKNNKETIVNTMTNMNTFCDQQNVDINSEEKLVNMIVDDSSDFSDETAEDSGADKTYEPFITKQINSPDFSMSPNILSDQYLHNNKNIIVDGNDNVDTFPNPLIRKKLDFSYGFDDEQIPKCSHGESSNNEKYTFSNQNTLNNKNQKQTSSDGPNEQTDHYLHEILNNNNIIIHSNDNVDKSPNPLIRQQLDFIYGFDDEQIPECSHGESSNNEKRMFPNQCSLNKQNRKQTSNDDVLKSILRVMTNLKYEVKDIATKIERVEMRQIEMMKNNDTTFEGPLLQNVNEILWKFPIKNIEELDKFEQKLLEDAFKHKVINYLKRLEKSTIGSMTREILSKLFHDDVLAQFSYVGQKGKKVFSSLNSCAVVFATIRSVPSFKNCTDLDILKPLKPYLANATSRGKLRDERADDNVLHSSK